MKIGVVGSGYIGNYLREAIIIDNNNKDQFQDFVRPKDIPIQFITFHENNYEIKSVKEENKNVKNNAINYLRKDSR
jgi:hypothetical protein